MDKDQWKYVSQNFEKKFNKVRKHPSLDKVENILSLFWKYFKDPNTSKSMKVLIVGTLVYFINPLDASPDFLPFVGYVDDVSLILWTYNRAKKELDEYQRKNP
jgi:uncharacterized membrane protein YkvA (DUF1232 family)